MGVHNSAFVNEDILHDIKNPLSVIQTVIKTLEYVKDDAEIFSKSLLILEKNILLLTKLTEDIRDYKGLFSGNFVLKKEKVYVESFVLSTIDAVSPIANGKNINIYLDTNFQKNDYIFIDKNATERIIRNLLSNGIKYSPKNSNVFLKINKINDKIIISVLDYGVGIDESEICKIFEKDYTKNIDMEFEKAQGLGLYIVKQIASAFGGNVFAKKLNIGSEIGISFKYVE